MQQTALIAPLRLALQRASILLVAGLFASVAEAFGAERTERAATDTTLATYLQRLYDYPQQFDRKHIQYTGDIYLRHNMYTKRRGPIVRLIPGMLRLESGQRNYLSEAQLRIAYRWPGEIDCKVSAYHSTSRHQRARRLTALGRFSYLIYDSKLFIDGLLNPFNHRNRRFYRYKLHYTTPPTATEQPLARISVTPRFSNDQLVEGHFDLEVRTGAIRNFTLSFRDQLSQVTVNATMGRESYATLVPVHMRIVCDLRLLGNRVHEVSEIFASHNFSCPLPDKAAPLHSHLDQTQYCTLRLDTTRINESPAYFDSIRPFPLREVEASVLAEARIEARLRRQADSIRQAQSLLPPETFADSVRLKVNARRRAAHGAENILLDAHYFQTNRSTFRLPPLITPSMLQWSGSKGLALKARFRWQYFTPEYGSTDYPRFEFTPDVGYSFKQRQVYWNLPMTLRFAPRYDGAFRIDAGGGSHMYNNRQATAVREELKDIAAYDSLVHILDHYGFTDYRDLHVKADFLLSPLPGLRLQLGGRYHRRSMIDWNEIAQQTGMLRRFSNIGPRLEVEWTPAQYYYRRGKRRLPLHSRWPTFTLAYERGFALGSGASSYERIEGDLHYRLPLYAMRTLYFRFGGGNYINRSIDCFLDYDYFRFNHMPATWDDELTGEYQLLSARWFNESRYYLRFNGTYESPMLLLSRIPLLTRIVHKERIYCNLLSVRSLPLYTELGYGLSTLFCDAGAFISIAPDRSLSFGCKIVLKFFEK